MANALVFAKGTGVLAFLRDTAGDDQVRELVRVSAVPPLLKLLLLQWEQCKETLLRFLTQYIAKLPGASVLPLCVEIKEACFTTFLRDRTARVKAASLAPLTSVRLCARWDPMHSVITMELLALWGEQVARQPRSPRKARRRPQNPGLH